MQHGGQMRHPIMHPLDQGRGALARSRLFRSPSVDLLLLKPHVQPLDQRAQFTE